jgi:hypothetical protein
MTAAELKSFRPEVWFVGLTVPTTAVSPAVAGMILSKGASADCAMSRSRNQSSEVYPCTATSGKTTRSERSARARSMARRIFSVFPS